MTSARSRDVNSNSSVDTSAVSASDSSVTSVVAGDEDGTGGCGGVASGDNFVDKADRRGTS